MSRVTPRPVFFKVPGMTQADLEEAAAQLPEGTCRAVTVSFCGSEEVACGFLGTAHGIAKGILAIMDASCEEAAQELARPQEEAQELAIHHVYQGFCDGIANDLRHAAVWCLQAANEAEDAFPNKNVVCDTCTKGLAELLDDQE